MNPVPWVIITDYPRWPSPYFKQLEGALPPGFGLAFAPRLAGIPRRAQGPGVINLHRLSRLYRGVDGRPCPERADALLAELDDLRRGGWRLVWTVHNLFPIRARGPDLVDGSVGRAVLAQADAVIAHTSADAATLQAMRGRGPVVVAGSAGLDAIPRQPASSQVQRLTQFLRDAPTGLLVLGNLAAYKGLPWLVRTFLDSTDASKLVMAGRPADPGAVDRLAKLAGGAGNRVLLHAEHVPPGNARVLCRAATALLSPYRTDGPFEFFRLVLHPSSVSMATGFGTPVVAPDLPSVRELTDGHHRALYRDSRQAAALLSLLDTGKRPWGETTLQEAPANRWASVALVYQRLAAEMTTARRRRIGTVTAPAPSAARRPSMTPPDIAHPTEQPDDPTGPAAVTALLESQFGLRVQSLDRLPIGQGTVNYRAQTDAGLVFVKSYPAGTDLPAESAGIRLSALAAGAGVPVARPRALKGDTFIAELGGSAASAWEYVDGHVIETGLSRAQLDAAGAALGAIHRTFASLAESRGPAPQVDPWLAFDADGFTATTDRLLAVIAARDEQDEFDEIAGQTLRERRAQAGHIPALIDGLPSLTAQVLHGDYSAVNLMFRADQLAAVIDFRPPDPFLVAYELGRIAYDPRTVTLARDWQDDASALISAYQRENPQAAPGDIAFSARAALIQLLTSLYGVKNHYLRPGLLQHDLDAFWLLRHRAATALLENLPAIEKNLRAQAA
jgi:Ser/Thr protein kinase RdoA (MazF antagonist)/glycosyltransferase involved in cell wall biosynthesis